MFNVPSNMQSETDSLGGGNKIEASAIIDFTIENAYTRRASTGSYCVRLELKSDQGYHSETLTIADSSGKVSSFRDGNEIPMRGYTIANHISQMTTGQTITDMYQATERKTIKVRDFALQKDVDTEVDMIVGLVGKTFRAGTLVTEENKQLRDPATNKYANDPSGATVRRVRLDKIFRVRDNLTAVEILAQETEPKFYTSWVEKNAGQVHNRVREVAGAQGTAGLPQAGAAAAAAPNLFG